MRVLIFSLSYYDNIQIVSRKGNQGLNMDKKHSTYCAIVLEYSAHIFDEVPLNFWLNKIRVTNPIYKSEREMIGLYMHSGVQNF